MYLFLRDITFIALFCA